MKKINNKGMTLVELIVSFAIVGVAMIYFYQTVSTVSKLYATSRDATDEYANSTYVLRLMDAYCNENAETKYSCGDATTTTQVTSIKNFCKKLDGSCTIDGLGSGKTTATKKGYKYYNTLTIKLGDDKEYKLLASVTPPVTYEINFYDGATLQKTVNTNSWYYDDAALQTPSKYNTNQWRVESITSSSITYQYYYQADNEYIVKFGQVVSKEQMQNKGVRIEYEGATTYRLDVKLQKGPLFTYTGGYEVIDEGSKNWRIKFKTGGDLTVNAPVNIDAFLVGGGGGGSATPKTNLNAGGAGGSGGNVITTTKEISEGTYSITIGAGGPGGTGAPYSVFGYNNTTDAKSGGTTSITGTDVNLSATGGGVHKSNDRREPTGNGGKGGVFNTTAPNSGGTGTTGFDDINYGLGGNGGAGHTAQNYWNGILSCSACASGGTASSKNGSNAEDYTGNGGGGAAARTITSEWYSGGNGGSGVVIIRNAR